MTAPASGVGGSLPYDIDTWLPVALATDGAALSLPVTASSAAAGVSTRRGTGAALTEPLTAATAAGAPRRAGAGAGCTLPLTAAPATGQAIGTYLSTSGLAIQLPFTTASGTARKQASLLAGVQALPLVDMTGNGVARRQGSGDPCTLALPLAGTTAQRLAVGAGAGAELRILAGQGDGRRYEWTFQTPTDYEHQPFSPIFPNVLTYTLPYSMTVWQDASGQWHQMRGPNPTLLSGALRIYEGGRLHVLSSDDIAILTAAGYGDNLVLQEMH